MLPGTTKRRKEFPGSAPDALPGKVDAFPACFRKQHEKLRGIYGIAIALLVIVSVALGAYIFSADASTGPSSTGLNTLDGYGLANEASAVWALNDSGHQAHWYSLSFTVDKTTNSITFATPLNEKISLIIVQTKNVSQGVYHLLQNGLLFTYTTFSTTDLSGSLSDAYMYFGEPVNATSSNAIADKGITDYALNQSLFDEQASYFGNSVQLQILPYLASNFASTSQYAFYLNESKNATGVYNSASITFSQYFEYTSGQQYPLVTYISAFALVILIIAIWVTYYASPEYDGGEESRAAVFQTRKEMGVTIAGLAGVVGILLIEGFLGNLTPLGGWGAAIGSLFFFGLFTYAFTEVPQRQKYTRTMGIGLIGMVVGLIVNMFWPFASIVYNFMTSGNVIAMIYGWLAVLFFTAMAYYGLIDTNRYKLHPRHVRMEARKLKA